MLKLKLQYFGHLIWRNDSLEKTLMLEDWRQEEKGTIEMRWSDGITDSMDTVWANSRSWWWTGRPGVLQSTGSQRVLSPQSMTEQLNWTKLNRIVFPLWLAIVNTFYILSGYWLWELINMHYYCDCVAITHLTMLYHDSVQFSCSVVSDSLQPHGLQHARLVNKKIIELYITKTTIS